VHVAVGTEFAVGVTTGVSFPQGLDVDMGVDLSGFHAFVAEHFLHVADVGSATVHVGGTGMPPKVAGAGFVDAAAFEQFFDPVAKVGGAEALAVTGEEGKKEKRGQEEILVISALVFRSFLFVLISFFIWLLRRLTLVL